MNDLKFPEEITEFFETENLTITVDDLNAYDVKDNVIYTASILSEDEIFLQWEPDTKNPRDIVLFGTYIDEL